MKEISSPVALLMASARARTRMAREAGAPALLTLVDKPQLQVAIEALALTGCRQLHLFFDEAPRQIRELVGNGERWGLQITCHYWDAEAALGQNFKRLHLDPEATYWVGNAEVIPEELVRGEGIPEPDADLVITRELGDERRWTGWGFLTGRTLLALPETVRVVEGGFSWPPLPAVKHHTCGAAFDVSTDASYLQSCLDYLRHKSRLHEQGLWIARGASIHRTARLVGPVYLGENARIEAGACVGPDAVIGAGALIDEGSSVERSVVTAETYLGGGMSLENAVASPGYFISAGNGSVACEVEPHLLSSARMPRVVPSLQRKLLAHTLQVLLWPLWRLARRPVVGSPPVASGAPPAGSKSAPAVGALLAPDHSALVGGASGRPREGDWVRHFAKTFYPGLAGIAAGRLDLFGLELRSTKEIDRLPAYWRELYHHHRCGLLNDHLLLAGQPEDRALHFASEVLTVGGLSRRRRMRIILTYLGQVMRELFGESCRFTAPQSASR